MYLTFGWYSFLFVSQQIRTTTQLEIYFPSLLLILLEIAISLFIRVQKERENNFLNYKLPAEHWSWYQV